MKTDLNSTRKSHETDRISFLSILFDFVSPYVLTFRHQIFFFLLAFVKAAWPISFERWKRVGRIKRISVSSRNKYSVKVPCKQYGILDKVNATQTGGNIHFTI